MNVLVTGASGLVGRYLLPALKARGHKIHILTREASPSAFRFPVACRSFHWKPVQERPSPESLEGIDAVIHLAGAGIADRRWTLARKHDIIRSRVHSTRNLLRAIRECPRKPQVFVSASAIGYYGDTGESIVDETGSRGEGFLAEVCREWEDEIFTARDIGLRTCAIRLGFVLGRGGPAMDRILPPFQLGLGGRLGNGRQWMSWIHARDAAGIFVRAIENPGMQGVYNAVAPCPETNRAFTKILGRVLNRPTLLPVPMFALKMAFGDMAQLLLSSQRVSSGKVQDAGYEFQFPGLESALRDICEVSGRLVQNEQWVPADIGKVFEFFSDPRNLETLTPSFLNFKILGKIDEALRDGVRLNYRLSLHGVPIRWQSRIFDWNPPVGFSDEQTRGPYAFWKHWHEFHEEDGGTVIVDRVNYRLPFHPLGELVAGRFVRRDLETIFNFRRDTINKLFGNSAK